MNRWIAAAALSIGGASLLFPAGASAEGDAAAGRDKTRMCAGCHGIPDYRIAYPEVYSVPRLGGQDAGYIAKELESYRAGRRKSLPMEGVAASLSDQDIADIAAYYAAAAPQSHGELDASGRRKAEEACTSCHGKEDGKPTLPGAPRLAGQQYDYLAHTLQAFRNGTRPSALMGAIAKGLSDDDIRALSRYYSTVRGLSAKY